MIQFSLDRKGTTDVIKIITTCNYRCNKKYHKKVDREIRNASFAYRRLFKIIREEAALESNGTCFPAFCIFCMTGEGEERMTGA